MWAGWAGQKTIGSGTTEFFNFNAPDKNLFAEIIAGINVAEMSANARLSIIVEIDDLVVFHRELNYNTSSTPSVLVNPVRLIFPAYSKIEIILGTTDGSGIPMTCVVTAKEI